MTLLANDNEIIMVDDNPGDVFLAQQYLEQSHLANAWLAFSSGPEFLTYLDGVRSR